MSWALKYIRGDILVEKDEEIHLYIKNTDQFRHLKYISYQSCFSRILEWFSSPGLVLIASCFILGTPGLDAEFQVGSHESREGQDQLPWSAAHRALMKMVNSWRPNTDPWEMPLITVSISLSKCPNISVNCYSNWSQFGSLIQLLWNAVSSSLGILSNVIFFS